MSTDCQLFGGPSLPRMFAAFLILLVTTGCGPDPDAESPPDGGAESAPAVGTVSFPTSCDAQVQEDFEAAVAMLHSFWFDEARAAFEDVAERDPGCAMAHWGVAMTQWGNPMTRAAPPPERVGVARQALGAARDAPGETTLREDMYLDAAEVLYEGESPAELLEGLREHEARMREIMDAHPDDAEAAIFYARAVIGNAPPDDLTYSRQLHAAEVMEPLFRDRPNHPGLAHYLIHAFDAPPIADEGADAAFRYADIAPDAPHALHMPTHIFTRLGYWEESIDLNARSAEASAEPDAAVHPLDYMVYAYLQLGRDREAADVVGRARSISDQYYGGMIGYNFAAMQARYALERERWSEAASLPVPDEALPYVKAVTRFARAVGAARAELPDQAAAEIRALEELRDELRARDDDYWSTVVEAQRLAAAAWEARARSRNGQAVQLATEAADLEATVEKHPVTPGPILPARELLGDLLLDLDRPAEAQAAYERTLETEPRRARALYGAARAAERAGDLEGARSHYSALLDLMEGADPDRPERLAASRFLENR